MHAWGKRKREGLGFSKVSLQPFLNSSAAPIVPRPALAPLPLLTCSALIRLTPPLPLATSPHFMVDEAALKLGAAYLASLAATYLSEAEARRSGTAGGDVRLGL